MNSICKPIYLAFLLFFVNMAVLKAQTNMKVISDKANIYAKANINSSPHINAKEGDIFKAKDIGNKWIQIHLFTGEKRFLKKSKTEVIHEISQYPSDPSVRSTLCKNVEEAKNKAHKKALVINTDNYFQQELYESLLTDKYILNTYRDFDIPASHYSKLMECIDDKFF